MTYQDQIKSPKWQKKRLEVMEEHNFRCQSCLAEDEQLHVHHTIYRKGRKIWDYTNIELLCLCEKCHLQTHQKQEKILESLSILEIVATLDYKDQVRGYIDGLTSSRLLDEDPSEYYMQGYVDGAKEIDLIERYKALSKIYGYNR